MTEKVTLKSEMKSLIMLTLGAVVFAFNMQSFINTGGLFPGGFAGITLLITRSASEFFGVALPYSMVYLPLNLIPALVAFKFIGKWFTLMSFYMVALSSFLTDLLPEMPITSDPMLISVFGGILTGVSVSLCLLSGASAGGTDFISIYFSEKKGIDTWNYVFMANVCILTLAGILFGFEAAMYSIIYQFCSTQVIQTLYKRYQKDTLLIITSQPQEVYQLIRRLTNHDATMIRGVGMYEGAERNILYSVVGRGQVDKVIQEIHLIDQTAFINVIQTEQITGRFYKPPTR
ncbi:MAG: YitT family protein [Firmicutes bacterium]|nr:YitT family protein [Bacillota bacterium]